MSEEKKPSVFGGFLRYFYGNFVVLILGLVSVPVITRIISTDEYGRSGMFTSVVTVIYIFAILGMDQTYIRYYYKEGIDRVHLMKQCLYPAVSIVAVLAVIYAVLAEPFNLFLFGENGTDIVLLVISYTVISVFERFLFLDIRMQQNGKLYSNLNILSKLLYIGLIFLSYVFLGDNFRVVLYAMTIPLGIVTTFIGVRYIMLCRRERGKGTTKPEGIVYPQKELISYGLPFILVLLMEWLLSTCDRYAIRIWSGYDELGIYNSAMNIMSILLTFKATFVAFWSPVAMEKYETDQRENCAEFFRKAFDITQFLCVGAAFGLILFRGVIVYLLGAKYRSAASILPFLTLMPIFSIMFEITNQGIKFKKKNRYLNYASAVAILFNVAGNTLLVPKFGGVGAAIATGITYMVYFAIGSLLAEKCYPVGYHFGKTAFYAVLLFFYAIFSTFTDHFWYSAGIGIVGILFLCVIDFKVLKEIIGFLIENISRLLRKQTSHS